VSDDRHEYLANKVQRDLWLAEALMRESLLSVLLENRDVHAIPWHDAEALESVSARLNGILAAWHTSVRRSLEDSLVRSAT
jgi:hypothetical protein